MKSSNIEWTDATWNPWHGCHKLSSECDHCYMYRDKLRYGQDPNFVVKSKTTFKDPIKWKDPKKIFVCSWSDFLIEEADPWRAAAFEIMAKADHHTYIIITKRPERVINIVHGSVYGDRNAFLPNWWWLVTAGTQRSAEKRIPEILKLRAWASWPVIGVSVEPMLEPINLSPWLPKKDCYWCPEGKDCNECHPAWMESMDSHQNTIDWVICGSESGPDRRPAKMEWIEDLMRQCVEAGVPFFLKQAEINGKLVKMPKINSQRFDQWPNML